MSEKIAVHCPTKDLWDKVREKVGTRFSPDWRTAHRQHKDVCLYHDGLWDRKEFCLEKGCTIISAEEYLKEGGEEVEFKVGDRVECVEKGDSKFLVLGKLYTISEMSGSKFQFVEGYGDFPTHGWKLSWFKLANKQTKTTKKEESNMQSTSINEVVMEVFEKKEDMMVVNEYLGGQIETMFEGCAELGIIWTTEHKTAVLKRAKDMQAEKETKEADKKPS